MQNNKRVVGIILLIAGAIMISIPFFYEWKQNQKTAALEEALSLVSQSDEVDLASINHLSLSQSELDEVIELEIPAIELKQKILPNTTEENLSIALTQIKSNQTLGEGNFTIAGHRGYREDRHFHSLPDVPIGAEVILHDKEERYIYEITSMQVIDPTYVEILEDKPNQNELTLITCTIDGKKRIALQGRLAHMK
ncbi:class D sortase [Virgibacillus sp. MG-45]|uniref:class D sortase n=1 Tax=Virgibacillus sp. MG-45 TaxID=3102791 RepID=UPI002ED916F2